MISIFNRRELCITRDAETERRVVSALDKAGIEHTVRSAFPTNPGRSHGAPGIRADAAYEYRVYVKCRDYKKAYSAICGYDKGN